MEPLFKSLVVGMVPRPTQIPPAAFAREDLERFYFDVTRDYDYPQLQMHPGDAGAQLVATPEDVVLLQPSLIQIQAKIELTPAAVTGKVMRIVSTAFGRLKIDAYLQCGKPVSAF